MNVRELFYNQLVNREALRIPVNREDGYPLYRPVATYQELMDFLNEPSKIPRDTYVSAYDYNPNNLINQHHQVNGNYLFGTNLRRKAKRVPYDYENNVEFSCLFFDFDEELLKSERDYLKSPDLTLEDKQAYMVEIIERRNLLRRPLVEAKELGELFTQMGLKPIYIFSGSKGVHLYVFFETIKLAHSAFMLRELYKKLSSLKTLDPLVFEPARKARVVLSINQKSGLFVKPINPDWDTYTILEDSQTPEPSITIDLTGNNSTMIHKVLKSYDNQAESLIANQKLMRKLQTPRKPKTILRKGNGIRTPADTQLLLKYPCFNNLRLDYGGLMLLISVLSFTDLKTPDSIEDGVLEFCRLRGLTLSKSKERRNKILNLHQKYRYGQRYMQDNLYCKNCDWKNCWCNSLEFCPEYY